MSRARGNIEFSGFLSDAEVADVLSRARAFVSASEEDFGIAMVEAQAAGCPVIAYGAGGALETVVDGYTGLFFPEQSADSIIEVVRAFERQAAAFDNQAIAAHARRFDKANFKRDYEHFILGAPAEAIVTGAATLPVSSLA